MSIEMTREQDLELQRNAAIKECEAQRTEIERLKAKVARYEEGLAADVERLFVQCRRMAKHLVAFPYGHNAGGCLEYRDDIKAEAQRLLNSLKGQP